ncbi:MAG: hypothetical protein JKY65_05635 [Planctomycetes bacterium]|nr:hypothetical protein [Planctomycetota bacterium]
MATILLAVTGSIAAYKAADLASKLSQAGHDVHVVMSEAACQLVGPSTFLNVTGNPVFTNLWDAESQTRHIRLTDAAQLAVLAPATANSIAKLATGLADDVVSTTLLALGCPLLVCPAMNVRMWRNPVVQRNLATVRALGHHVMEPGAGHLACGHVGPGRLAEPPEIAAEIEKLLGHVSARVSAGDAFERLLGPWQLAGILGGMPVQQTVLAEPILGGTFVRLHCLPGEGFAYEAIVTLGRASPEGDHSLHLVESVDTKAASSQGVGHAVDADTFEFALTKRDARYVATLSWIKAEEGWDVSVGPEGEEAFAVLQLRRS